MYLIVSILGIGKQNAINLTARKATELRAHFGRSYPPWQPPAKQLAVAGLPAPT